MNILLSRNAVRALFILLALSTSLNASAVTSFLNEWRNMYPESTSGDINCQLCHINAEGGEPWNAYGSALEQHYNRDGVDFSTRTIQESFTFVEALNSDQDSDPSTTNLEEINTNQQPGWREGQVNPNFLREGLALGLSFPPLTVDPFTQKIESQDVSLELVEIANGFTAPLGGVQAPVNSLRSQMFVTDQIGIVWRVDLNTGEKSEYLNVSHRLVELGLPNLGNYDERGLLGFAFHPEFTSNGRLYIYTSEPASSVADFTTLNSNQIADHQSVISELVVENPSQREGLATISSQRELMRLDQPQFNHNGGALVFDTQGLLYIGLGDGGNADDQGVGHSVDGNSSDLSNPYGSILRIDPLGNSHGAYGVPLDNPFVVETIL